MTTPRSPPVPAIDKSALALIRRVLCSHAPPSTPLEELLPALTSSPDVDLQLYALLAVVFRDFVYSWYSKITTDTVFVQEVVAVVAHCSRAIEERLRKVECCCFLEGLARGGRTDAEGRDERSIWKFCCWMRSQPS